MCHNMQAICQFCPKNMQVYANNMHLICTKYANTSRLIWNLDPIG